MPNKAHRGPDMQAKATCTTFMREIPILLHEEILAIHHDSLARPGGRSDAALART